MLKGEITQILPTWDEYSSEIEGRKILYGKANYPRYFEAGDRMSDNRSGLIPDYSYPRIEFYLVGPENNWVALPLEDAAEYFPHSCEVIVFAKGEESELRPDGLRLHGEYYKASLIVILRPSVGEPEFLRCSGANCGQVFD